MPIIKGVDLVISVEFFVSPTALVRLFIGNPHLERRISFLIVNAL
jgi:hypothetical protein